MASSGENDRARRPERRATWCSSAAAARVDHVGIYVGEGRFVHAPSTGKDVMVYSLTGLLEPQVHAGAARLRRLSRRPAAAMTKGRLSGLFHVWIRGFAMVTTSRGLQDLPSYSWRWTDVFLAVPALHREAEARARRWRCPASRRRRGSSRNSGMPMSPVIHAPAAVGLPAEQLEAATGAAVAEGPALADHGLRTAIAVEVAHLVDAGALTVGIVRCRSPICHPAARRPGRLEDRGPIGPGQCRQGVCAPYPCPAWHREHHDAMTPAPLIR